MMRADAARKLDPFQRPERVYAEDFDLYHRIAAVDRIARIDDELLTYRSHGGRRLADPGAAMRDRAADVLADAYGALFSEAAADTAALIVRHVRTRQPIPDRATFERVGRTLVALQDDFLVRHKPDAESRDLIRWETARRWDGSAAPGCAPGG